MMQIRQLESINLSVKTLIFAFIFFCFSNFHHLKAILDLTSLHYTLIPFLLFTDLLDIFFMAIAYHKSPNKNFGQTSELVISTFRILIGIIAGITLNYFTGTTIALLGPYFLLTGLSIAITNSLVRAIIHTITNRHLNDHNIQNKLRSEWLIAITFTFILAIVGLLFFSGIQPVIYIASIIGTSFMLGASLYSAFQIFDPPPILFPARVQRHQPHFLSSYYQVLEGYDLESIKDPSDLKEAINKKLMQLKSDKINKPSEQNKLAHKIAILDEVQTILSSDQTQSEKAEALKQCHQHHFLAFQSFFKHISDTEALYQIADEMIASP